MSAPKYFVPVLLLLAACTEPQPAPDLPDWSPGFPTNDTSDTSGTSDFSAFRITVDMGEVDTRFGLASDPTAPCELDPVDGQFSELECQLEINELDLWFHGWNYNAFVAADTCEYLAISHYYYQAWSSGTGPTSVVYQVDTDGNFLQDVENSEGGEPSCEFDHTNPDIDEAPNCCYGEYVVTQIVIENGVEVDRIVEDPEDWGGGKLAECYDGAAFAAEPSAFEVNTGLPIQTVVDIDERFNEVYNVFFSSAESQQDKTSNVMHANFFDGDTPIGLQPPTGGSPLYTIECLDRAAEITARVNLTVREWDERSEFDASGNPNSGIQATPGGTPPLEDSGSGSPINDRFDWADFVLNGNDYVGIAD